MLSKRSVSAVCFFLLFSSSVSAKAMSDLSIAVGETYGNVTDSIFATSHDQESSWMLTHTSNDNESYRAETVSCEGVGTNALCAIGGNLNSNTSLQPLFISVSLDGFFWHHQPIAGLPTNIGGIIDGVNCFSMDKGTQCMATGIYDLPNNAGYNLGFVALSQPGAQSWTAQTIAGIPPTVKAIGLNDSACSGQGANTLCVVEGLDDQSHPLIVNTTDAGNSWHYNAMTTVKTGLPVACAGQRTTGTCVIPQDTNASWNVDVGVSHDSGKTWDLKPLISTENIFVIEYSATSCTGSGANALCVISGYYATFDDNNLKSFLAVSNDSGNTWQIQTPLDQGYFYSATCGGEGSNTVCMAVGSSRFLDGQGFAGEKPVLLVSVDGGKSWSQKTIPNYTNGVLTNVRCENNSKNVICRVEGNVINQSNLTPFLAVSDDKGNTWQTKSIASLAPNKWGQLYA